MEQITVGELIKLLNTFDDDLLVFGEYGAEIHTAELYTEHDSTAPNNTNIIGILMY